MTTPVGGELEPFHAMMWAYAWAAEARHESGSAYIRKVHFRDTEMIHQIESKVVNRLRQVTSAINQDGVNQVSIISSSAERQAAVEFAKAAAVKPQTVGAALREITEDPELAEVLFEILDDQKMVESPSRVTQVPPRSELLT